MEEVDASYFDINALQQMHAHDGGTVECIEAFHRRMDNQVFDVEIAGHYDSVDTASIKGVLYCSKVVGWQWRTGCAVDNTD